MPWINTEESIPPDETWVHIMTQELKTTDSGMIIASSTIGTGMWSNSGHWILNSDYRSWNAPTHWMPLSKLPDKNDR